MFKGHRIVDMDTFRSVTEWMPLTHEWDGSEYAMLTGDEYTLLKSCLEPFVLPRGVRKKKPYQFVRLTFSLAYAKAGLSMYREGLTDDLSDVSESLNKALRHLEAIEELFN